MPGCIRAVALLRPTFSPEMVRLNTLAFAVGWESEVRVTPPVVVTSDPSPTNERRVAPSVAVALSMATAPTARAPA